MFLKKRLHLDFHNSALIPKIGEEFDEREFISDLKRAHVDSVTVFAKCHHSYCYYPTEVGIVHPGLKKTDLLERMYTATREAGIEMPIYITVGWSQTDADTHDEWCVRDLGGAFSGYYSTSDAEEGFPYYNWKRLCVNTGYAETVYAVTKEVCLRYPELSGVFFDIVFQWEECYCEKCRVDMAKKGIDINDSVAVKKFYAGVWGDFAGKCRALVAEHCPAATVFFNGSANIGKPEQYGYNTHIELEDLPTSWGGYDKMPVRTKYFLGKKKDYLGMTGKFHTAWGEFGGYKTPEALTYECAMMYAFSAGCSVGDQLHPSAKTDKLTFDNIAAAYGYLSSIEEYCFHNTEIADLGMLISKDAAKDEGLARLLLDLHIEFGVIDEIDEIDAYKTVIVSELKKLSPEEGARLCEYAKRGGTVMLINGCSLNDKQDFVFDFGAEISGAVKDDVEYVRFETESADFMSSPMLFYGGAPKIRVNKGEILATSLPPYFNRRKDSFSSHQQAPYNPSAEENVAAFKNGNILYIGHDIGKMYHSYGNVYMRRYFETMLGKIYTPAITVGLPASARIRHYLQRENNREILHLFYGVPVQRGSVCVMDDMPKMHNIEVSVKTNRKIANVIQVKPERKLNFQTKNGTAFFTVPDFQMHTVLVLEFDAEKTR